MPAESTRIWSLQISAMSRWKWVHMDVATALSSSPLGSYLITKLSYGSSCLLILLIQSHLFSKKHPEVLFWKHRKFPIGKNVKREILLGFWGFFSSLYTCRVFFSIIFIFTESSSVKIETLPIPWTYKFQNPKVVHEQWARKSGTKLVSNDRSFPLLQSNKINIMFNN